MQLLEFCRGEIRNVPLKNESVLTQLAVDVQERSLRMYRCWKSEFLPPLSRTSCLSVFLPCGSTASTLTAARSGTAPRRVPAQTGAAQPQLLCGQT